MSEKGDFKMEWHGCLKKESVRDLVRCISRFERGGRPPLVRDLMAELGSARQTLFSQFERLEEEQLIWREGAPGETKLLHLTDLGRRAAYHMGAPVLGEVPAGLTERVVQDTGCDAEGAQIYRQSWDDALPCNENFASLTVKGDSMIGDSILEGDEVHLRCGRRLIDLEDGEIAAVMVGDDYEATFKHVHFDAETGIVTLRASNERYEPMEVPAAQVRLVGTVRGIVRLNPLEVNRK